MLGHTVNYFYNIRIFGKVTTDTKTFGILATRISDKGLISNVESDVIITGWLNAVALVLNVSASVMVSDCDIKMTADVLDQHGNGLFYSTFEAKDIEVVIQNYTCNMFVGS